jgi:hypothetical protein
MKESGLLPVLAKLIKKFSARWAPRHSIRVASPFGGGARVISSGTAPRGGSRKRGDGGGGKGVDLRSEALFCGPPPVGAGPAGAAAAGCCSRLHRFARSATLATATATATDPTSAPNPPLRHEPRSAACVLAEAVHLVLRLYDRLVAREGGKFYVRWGAGLCLLTSHTHHAAHRTHLAACDPHHVMLVTRSTYKARRASCGNLTGRRVGPRHLLGGKLGGSGLVAVPMWSRGGACAVSEDARGLAR